VRYAVVHFADGRTAECHPTAAGVLELGPLGSDVAKVELVGEALTVPVLEPPSAPVEVEWAPNSSFPEDRVKIHVPPSSPLARAAYEQRAKPARRGKP
jgi:hypothetical protein